MSGDAVVSVVRFPSLFWHIGEIVPLLRDEIVTETEAEWLLRWRYELHAAELRREQAR